MRIRLRPDEGDGDGREMHWIIEDVVIAYGGMAPMTTLAKGAMAYMVGKTFGEETFVGARRALLEEFDIPDDAPGGQAKYRMTLAAR
jgi:xanthine dehydrogenase/oxidase